MVAGSEDDNWHYVGWKVNAEHTSDAPENIEETMTTIDQMIERLQELRELAPEGGETPMVIRDLGNIYEQACADLMPVTVYMTGEGGVPVNWENRDEGNTHQVVRVF